MAPARGSPFDWSFADGTGLELCRQIRAFDARTTILFYTGEIDQAAVEAALVAGAQGCLIKPVAAEWLLQAISDYVGLED